MWTYVCGAVAPGNGDAATAAQSRLQPRKRKPGPLNEPMDLTNAHVATRWQRHNQDKHPADQQHHAHVHVDNRNDASHRSEHQRQRTRIQRNNRRQMRAQHARPQKKRTTMKTEEPKTTAVTSTLAAGQPVTANAERRTLKCAQHRCHKNNKPNATRAPHAITSTTNMKRNGRTRVHTTPHTQRANCTYEKRIANPCVHTTIPAPRRHVQPNSGHRNPNRRHNARPEGATCKYANRRAEATCVHNTYKCKGNMQIRKPTVEHWCIHITPCPWSNG